MAENTVDQNTDQSLLEMDMGPGKRPTTTAPSQVGSIANKQSDFMGTFANSVSDSITKEMGTGPKTLAQRLAPAPIAGGTKYYDPSQVDRYTGQEGFNSWGFDASDQEGNNTRAASQETMSSALSKGFDSFGDKFGNTFKDYWKSYGRMGNAIIHGDWELMKPDEGTMLQQYYNDQVEADKNFVFQKPEDEDGIFTKRTMSEFIGNSGFALGTFAGMGVEIAADIAITWASGGLGAGSFIATATRLAGQAGVKVAAKEGAEVAAKTAAKNGFSLGNMLKGFELGNKGATEISASANLLKKIQQTETVANMTRASARGSVKETFNMLSHRVLDLRNSKSLVEFGTNLAKSTPVLGTGIAFGEKIAMGAKAGLTSGELIGIGLQGARRMAQEINLSATEASFEAVTTTGDTLNQMLIAYREDHDGENPSGEEFDKMRATASNASSANYATNMAVLMGTNKLQFGNLFNKFLPASKVLNELLAESAENVALVQTKGLRKLYEKGFAGMYGLTGQIYKDMGKKEAAYQIGMAFLKDVGSFEIAEGLQENVQETSANGWKDFYANKYRNTDITLTKAFGEGAREQFTKQGLKTFLMGAFTGSVIRLPTAVATRSIEKVRESVVAAQYKADPSANPMAQAKAQIRKDIASTNTVLKDLQDKTFVHKAFNFAAQINTAENMTEAAAKGMEYEFHNNQENSLLAAVGAAKRTNSIDALYDAIKGMGNDTTVEEFESQFKIKLEDTKHATPIAFAHDVARQVKQYSEAVDSIRKNVGPLSEPSMYALGSVDKVAATLLREAQEDAIEFIAMNSMKGTMAADRAKKVTEAMSRIPGISTSSDYALRVLTNTNYLDSEIGNIMGELRIYGETLDTGTLTGQALLDMKAQQIAKKEEARLLTKWQSYWTKKNVSKSVDPKEAEWVLDEFVGKKVVRTQAKDEEGNPVTFTDEDVAFDRADKEVADTFAELMNIKNKQAGVSATIGQTDMRNGFSKVSDYLRLDKDTKDYMRSVDALTNPEQYMLALKRMANGKFKQTFIILTDNIINKAGEATRIATEEIFQITQDPDSLEKLFVYRNEMLAKLQLTEAYKNLMVLVVSPDLGYQNHAYAITLFNEIEESLATIAEEIVDRETAQIVKKEEEVLVPEETQGVVVEPVLTPEEEANPNGPFGENTVVVIPEEESVDQEDNGDEEEVVPGATPTPEPDGPPPVSPAGFSAEELAIIDLYTKLRTGVIKPEDLTPEDMELLSTPGTEDLGDVVLEEDNGEGLAEESTVEEGSLPEEETLVEEELVDLPEQEVLQTEPFVAEGLFIRDKQGNLTTQRPAATEQEAIETAALMSIEQYNIEWTSGFFNGSMSEVANPTELTANFYAGALKSMQRFNTTNKAGLDPITMLEEYAQVPNGKRALTSLKTRLLNPKVKADSAGVPVLEVVEKEAVSKQDTSQITETTFITKSKLNALHKTLSALRKSYTEQTQDKTSNPLQVKQLKVNFAMTAAETQDAEAKVIAELQDILTCL
jgi:hypothetical protein